MNLNCAKRWKRLKQWIKWKLQGVVNMWRFRKVIWNFYHWDYAFQIDVIEQMLIECERKWVVETIYVGDKFTCGRIRVLLKNLDEYRNGDCSNESEALRRFLSRYARTLPRLWD